MPGTLYVVGTPIGNLNDLSPRALETLEKVDFIACEDTRVTVKLLNHFEIKKELVSYYEHNKTFRGDVILRRIGAGESCALVSDAGMPAISDPGEDLVREALTGGIPVETVPGPSAVTTALAFSGMSCSRWCFEGFLPVETAQRRKRLESLSAEERTMVFYEAPHKLIKTLSDLEKAFGDRPAALVHELTKIHESVSRNSLSALREEFKEKEPRGEYVLIVSGVSPKDSAPSAEEGVRLAKEFISAGEAPGAAAKRAARLTGLKRNEIYDLLINQTDD